MHRSWGTSAERAGSASIRWSVWNSFLPWMFFSSVLPFRTSQFFYTVAGCFLIFEKVRQTRKSGINFLVLAIAFIGIQILAAFWAKTFAILLAQKTQGKIHQNRFLQKACQIDFFTFCDDDVLLGFGGSFGFHGKIYFQGKGFFDRSKATGTGSGKLACNVAGESDESGKIIAMSGKVKG